MYIIAEIGSNYHSLEDCLVSIKLAKECGADAVKFQHYEAAEMWGVGDKVVTPEEWLPILKRMARKTRIGFSCTFFNPEKLLKYKHLLSFVKIASSNMMDKKLIEAGLSTNKATYISTGGHLPIEISRVRDEFPYAKYLYCDSVYPSNVTCKAESMTFDGISDHSLSIYPDYRYQVIEKHVNLVGAKMTADAPHSLNKDQFNRFCTYMKYGIVTYLKPEEGSMRLLHNVRLVARKNIEKGQQLNWGNISVMRGTTPTDDYINPFDEHKVIGYKAARDINKLDVIRLKDVATPKKV